MLSFTSSSNLRIPDAPYAKSICLTFCILILMLVGLEGYWRYKGFMPSVTDTPLFWAMYRNEVYEKGDDHTLVILGASRAQIGIDPEVLEKKLNLIRVVNLSIVSGTSLEVLEDLADDTRFTGSVLWSVNMDFLTRKPSPVTCEYLDVFHKIVEPSANYDAKCNGMVFAWLQERFVVLDPQLSLGKLIGRRSVPRPSYSTMRYDRQITAHYRSRLTIDQIKKSRETRIKDRRRNWGADTIMSSSAFMDSGILKRITLACTKIKERGGKVIMVRMPTTGGYWDMEESIYPRHLFWDKMEPLCDAQMIHFLDYEELARFDCPDASHLDAADSSLFTENLANIMLGLCHH